jgi:hypothetical protein
MKNPANPQAATHMSILDADPWPSGFSYSTCDQPLGGEKAPTKGKAGGTGALEAIVN